MKTSKHADLLNALYEMQLSPVYAVRREALSQAEQVIFSQEEAIARLERDLAEARAEQRKEDAKIARQKIIIDASQYYDDGYNDACDDIARAIEEQEA